MLTQVGPEFHLDHVLSMPNAVQLRESLLGVIAAGDDLYVNGQNVERVSTPCLQVLYAAAVEVEAAGGHFHLRKPSQVLSDALTDLGMGQQLKRWSAVQWD